MKRWFLPRQPDLLGLLAAQADVTLRGLEAFRQWSSGDADSGLVVRGTEHEADAARRSLLSELRNAFTTPLEPEDIYELSERLDTILNGAKNAVREAEVMDMMPDPPLAAMATQLAEGLEHITIAVRMLGTDKDTATVEADAATACERKLERVYRRAMSELLKVDDPREVTGRRELYRRYARIGEGLVGVAHRVWYAVVKQS